MRRQLSYLRTAFTLLETLAAVVIIAVLLAVMVPQVANFVATAQRESDKRTLTVLNDALTRYKTEGGDVNALTYGAPVGNILARMQQPINWSGMVHQVMKQGETYPARSITAIGNKRTYRISRFNCAELAENKSLYNANSSDLTISTWLGATSGSISTGSRLSVHYNNAICGLVKSPDGSVYFHAWVPAGIYKVLPDGNVLQVFGSMTGLSYSENMCYGPDGLLWWGSFTPYKRVYKLTPQNNIETFAGNGTNAIVDGPRLSASFKAPLEVAFGNNGDMYISDDSCVRRIDGQNGIVSTISSGPPLGGYTRVFFNPIDERLYVSNNQKLYIFNPQTPAQYTTINIPEISSAVFDSDGNMYYCERFGCRVLRLNLNATTPTLIAGTGIAGRTNGEADQAQLYYPYGICLDTDGSILVGEGPTFIPQSDNGYVCIRRISLK